MADLLELASNVANDGRAGALSPLERLVEARMAIRPRTSVLQSAGVGALEPFSMSDDGGSEENRRECGAENDSAT